MGRSWEIVVWLLVFAAAAAVVIGIVRSEAAVTADDLRLSEILAGPARDWDGDGVFDSRKDEWLELQNYGAAAVDLSAYRVSDADSTIRFAFSGSLAPGAVVLVTGRQAEDWQRSVGRTVSGLSLNYGDFVSDRRDRHDRGRHQDVQQHRGRERPVDRPIRGRRDRLDVVRWAQQVHGIGPAARDRLPADPGE